ncbi:MAG: glycosyltransferase family 4 protein [Arenicellales bacterium]
MDINFLSKTQILGYGTTQMRCVQPSEYLNSKGWCTGVGCIYRNLPTANKAIVFHRVNLDPHTSAVLAYARAKGLVAIYDTDDLLYTDEANNHLAGFLREKNQDRNNNLDMYRGYQEMMQRCDVVLVSTNYLKERAERFHSDVRLVKNGLSKWFEKKADIVIAHQHINDNRKVTIAYLSGSKHHDIDFKIVEEVLLKLLDEVPQAHLLIVGKINYSDLFHNYGDRFHYIPFMKYEEYWRVFEDIDINIAPLNMDDAFVQARSEIKYMEAGVFGVPTIASPTQTYCEAIDNEVTGLLVKNDGWYNALQSLLLDGEKRTRLGEAARADVLENYSHDVRALQWDNMISEIIESYSGVAGENMFVVFMLKLKIIYLWLLKMIRIGRRKVSWS